MLNLFKKRLLKHSIFPLTTCQISPKSKADDPPDSRAKHGFETVFNYAELIKVFTSIKSLLIY